MYTTVYCLLVVAHCNLYWAQRVYAGEAKLPMIIVARLGENETFDPSKISSQQWDAIEGVFNSNSDPLPIFIKNGFFGESMVMAVATWEAQSTQEIHSWRTADPSHLRELMAKFYGLTLTEDVYTRIGWEQLRKRGVIVIVP